MRDVSKAATEAANACFLVSFSYIACEAGPIRELPDMVSTSERGRAVMENWT